jgi:hypothetical protein
MTDSGSVGWGFESLRVRQYEKKHPDASRDFSFLRAVFS